MTRLIPLMLVLASCPGDPTDATDDPAPLTWSAALQDDDRGAFLMVWGPDGGDVWVVGGQPDAGVVLKGSADNLQAVTVPEGTPLLNWVHGTTASDVWVGGLNGTVLHWDGSAWEDRSLEIDEAIWGVHAVSATEAWAVGGTSAWGGETARIFHWQGGTWTPLDLPEVLEDPGNLFKAHHDGTSLWACGLGGVVVRSNDGTSLEAIPTGFAADIVTVHGMPGQKPIFVGGRGTGAVLEVDGDALTRTASARSGLSGVHVYEAGSAVVVGERGFAGIYDIASDEIVEVPVPTDDVLHGVFVDRSGQAWAAGGNLYTSGDSFLGSVWIGTFAEENP